MATVNLSKNEKVNLSKMASKLESIMIGLGWDPAGDERVIEEVVKPGFIAKLFGATERVERHVVRNNSSEEYDLDAWVMLLSDGKLRDKEDTVWYGDLKYYHNGDLVIEHMGDNLTGRDDGSGKDDDEQIIIKLDKLPKRIDEIVIAVTIYKGKQKGQTFDEIQNTYVRVINQADNTELCRFNQAEMREDKGSYTFIAGRLYKEGGEWQFEAIGKGTKHASISDLANEYMMR